MMRIEIICTGDEVLTGKIVNTNFSYISQKLEDVGLSVRWETTVGDDRESLLRALRLAGERADAVIVNGGLGPTVDDLSQEVAAQAAGVELVLNDEWLTRMEEFFRRRSRVMPPNNRKQAMLPATAEVIDNPIGTACGFALDIGQARFFFTPGVPRELHRMLEEQIIPRLLAKSGMQTAIVLKRFHSYGLGESHVDALLRGVEELVPDGSVKLGFRAHYPQLETKLAVRGPDTEDNRRKLAPVEREVRKRLGNFILSEDDATPEGVVVAKLASRQGWLSMVNTFTSGAIAARLAHLPGAEKVFGRGVVARALGEVYAAVGLEGASATGELTRETAEAVARAARRQTGATHALAVLIDLDDGADRIDLGGTICLAIATEHEVASRRSRILGGREWVRLGAVEMGLDCLRRYLQKLPVYERIDLEKACGGLGEQRNQYPVHALFRLLLAADRHARGWLPEGGGVPAEALGRSARQVGDRGARERDGARRPVGALAGLRSTGKGPAAAGRPFRPDQREGRLFPHRAHARSGFHLGQAQGQASPRRPRRPAARDVQVCVSSARPGLRGHPCRRHSERADGSSLPKGRRRLHPPAGAGPAAARAGRRRPCRRLRRRGDRPVRILEPRRDARMARDGHGQALHGRVPQGARLAYQHGGRQDRRGR